MNKQDIILPELLAPAGSAESFEAAISAGADAVYFGTERFSARARAKNLSFSEISSLLRECRARGVKANGAINTRLRDGELSDALMCAEDMLAAGTDALIIADLGLADEIRRVFPEAVLHASTQITGSSAADAKALADIGFSRMVCPRELSLEELRLLVKDSPIGIEMFIHGAHCVSVSGQCSMSYVMGGRSGNRGDCAGPCRLPFDSGLGDPGSGVKPSRYAISLKDMCLAGHIREIIELGVESLKIEGRLKGPEYTYGVVSIYRKLLDEKRDADPDEMAELTRLFSRDGFSDGYIKNTYGNMLGTRRESEVRQKSDEVLVPPPSKVPVKGKLRLFCGETAKLEVSSPYGKAEVTGEVLSAAVGNPPSEESLMRSVSKLGQTPFVMESLTVETDGICGIAASKLNALRREAVDILCAPPQLVKTENVQTKDKKDRFDKPNKLIRAAVLCSADQMIDTVLEYFDEVYLPFAGYLCAMTDKKTTDFPGNIGVSLPEVLYGGLEADVKSVLDCAASEGRNVLVHSIGELSLAVSAGASAVCSHRFVVYNKNTASKLYGMGAKSVTLSPEISVKAAGKISAAAPVSVLTGGRMPLMLCRRCPMSDGGKKCRMNRSGGFDGKKKASICRGYLRDRTGAILPSVGDRYCMTTVFNSVPTWSDLSEKEFLSMGVSRTFYMFSVENGERCDGTVKNIKNNVPPDVYRKLR